MITLARGSIHWAPVSATITPAMITPTEITASAAMCRKAPLTLASCSRPRMNIRAVTPLMTTPTPAVIITVKVCTGAGARKRWIASQTMAPETNTRTTPLIRAANTVALLKP